MTLVVEITTSRYITSRQTSENSPPACVPVYNLTSFSSSSCVVRAHNRSSSLPIWVYKAITRETWRDTHKK
uniref:Uncharacterized protein n=1 Tax=Trichogramma kaykai TaxID=54128 RepID=A0ABD2XF32_9HYME